MKGHLSAEQLKEYSYKDLQALAKDMGVSASGKAEEIIARIAAVEVDVSESELTEEEKALFDAEAARQEEERAAEQAAREQEEAAQAAEKAAAEQKAREEAAGLVKVKAVTRFLDKQLNQIKDAGEAYSVSRERAEELTAAGVAEIVG
ncbi:hypothetical protein [Otoolea muris]|uniref:hypothetical protein n=1 Tax=Otoolea muris TaxID=2941515 RepID=UPI00203E7B9C|nr:hypothetical protein [Otoolea muris]